MYKKKVPVRAKRLIQKQLHTQLVPCEVHVGLAFTVVHSLGLEQTPNQACEAFRTKFT